MLKHLPVFWLHIPDRVAVSDTSNGPQHGIGNYFGPYNTFRLSDPQQSLCGTWHQSDGSFGT